MALSAARSPQRETRGAHSINQKIADGIQVYRGSYLALGTVDNATSGKDGYLFPWTGAIGEIPIPGFAKASVEGEVSDTPIPNAQAMVSDWIEYSVAVTGASTQILAVGKEVYRSDDDTATLTKPTNRGIAQGLVVKWYSSTTCDVMWFGLGTIFAICKAGGGTSLIHLGTVDFATITAANIVTALPLAGHGKFIDFFAIVEVPMVGSGGTATVNLEIATVDVTGGVITVSTAAGGTKGTKLAGTAITAANEFHDGQTLDIEGAAPGGTQTSGRVALYGLVQWLPGV